ncbi:hypothetical protein EMCRGX_G024767 [Ephydatia muelleri]
MSSHLEVGSGWGQESSRTRPADILVTNWDNGISAAFDVTVASPLNSSTITEAGMYSGAAAKAAELRKHTKNDSKCAELSWKCIPLAARLLSVSSPNASVWISVVPSLSLGLHLDPNEFQTAVKWWLGVNLSLNFDGLSSMPQPLTLWVTTVSGDKTTRHNTLRNVVTSTLQQAGLSAHLEVGCGWGQDNSRTRPADILVTNWDCGISVAFDISVAFPLNSAEFQHTRSLR